MCFKPCGIPRSEVEVVELAFEELEAIRLVDVDELTQEEAALEMGISRRAFWEELKNARKKVARALVEGQAIDIKGGNYTTE
ncbi:hypothetical protein B0H22_10882 [Methanohalophilus euhalobius]|jgi:hypothetical protein|nr:MAG: hypothetical protein A8273_442 [Methanohalophilus sp. 2-GBenrich]PQV42214.1 hypothetical protein B0H22_10882 [Methanohalophilus euhalobius]RSD35970.1 MAG: hypothetical protein CI952_596 [Methanohalophilus sp.]RXG33546.1 hypothetical protein CI957_1779 [Methanohalophilus sp. WG1-DM]SNY19787.1 hypothetical protein SAMN06295989_1108 [Methanohalophilus euhalobius]